MLLPDVVLPVVTAPAASLVKPVNVPDSATARGDKAEPTDAVIEIGVEDEAVSVIVKLVLFGTVATK